MSRVILQSGVRTGSHLILDAYETNGYQSLHIDTSKYHTKTLISNVNPRVKESDVQIFDPSQNNVVLHSHVGYVPTNSEEYDLVVSRRKDKVAQILSFVVARTRAEWVIEKYHKRTNAIGTTPLSDKKHKPFAAPKDVVDHAVRVLLDLLVLQNKLIQEHKWKSVKILFLEDIQKNGPIWMHNQLGLNYNENYIWDQQTRHKAKDVISNYNAVLQYVKQEVTEYNRNKNLTKN